MFAAASAPARGFPEGWSWSRAAVTRAFLSPSDLAGLAAIEVSVTERGASSRYAGHNVAFTVSEMDPSFGNRTAHIATSLNGGPSRRTRWAAAHRPTEDELHARWVRQLVRLRVIRLPSGSAVPVPR